MVRKYIRHLQCYIFKLNGDFKICNTEDDGCTVKTCLENWRKLLCLYDYLYCCCYLDLLGLMFLFELTWEAHPTPWTKTLFITWDDDDEIDPSLLVSLVVSWLCWILPFSDVDLAAFSDDSSSQDCDRLPSLWSLHAVDDLVLWNTLATVPSNDSREVLTGATVLGDVAVTVMLPMESGGLMKQHSKSLG